VPMPPLASMVFFIPICFWIDCGHIFQKKPKPTVTLALFWGTAIRQAFFKLLSRTLEMDSADGRPCWPPPSTGRLPGSACACKRARFRMHRALGNAAEPQAVASEFQSVSPYQVSRAERRDSRPSDVVRECRMTLSTLSLISKNVQERLRTTSGPVSCSHRHVHTSIMFVSRHNNNGYESGQQQQQQTLRLRALQCVFSSLRPPSRAPSAAPCVHPRGRHHHSHGCHMHSPHTARRETRHTTEDTTEPCALRAACGSAAAGDHLSVSSSVFSPQPRRRRGPCRRRWVITLLPSAGRHSSTFCHLTPPLSSVDAIADLLPYRRCRLVIARICVLDIHRVAAVAAVQ
jgi:hypothetical protein